MGDSWGPRAGQDLVPNRVRPGGSAAAVLDFAVAQILRDDTALGVLPAVLERLVAVFGLRAAVAFRPTAGQTGPGQTGRGQTGRGQTGRGQAGPVLGEQPTSVLAAYPADAAGPALLAALSIPQREAARGVPVQLAGQGAAPASAMVTYSTPVDGQCLCVLALIGEAASWDEEIRSTAHAVAALVATQLRHANDLAQLAERQAQIERSHDALADQTERLNCLIAAAIPGVLITDEQGRITHVSQSFGAMFGIDDPPALVGTSAVAVVRRICGVFADPGRFVRRAVSVFRARRPMSGEQIMSADGRTIECDYWPILVGGRYRGDLWLTWDMSDRKELEQQRMAALEAELAACHLAERAQRQLTEQNERLRRIDEARNQFLAIVSHELRTPLTSIVSFIELIRGEAGGLTPEGLSFLDIIERNADRLHRLIGDLLMLDRLEAGALPLDLAAVSVPDLVTEAVRAATPGAAKQGVTLTVSVLCGPPVQGDARRLMQVLDNLIANAVKFSHRNGLVRVTAGCDRGTWRIEVADSGIGIPAEEAGELFSRFVRGSNARTAGLPGSGLGLSIVKVLAEMHGGHVEVRSTLGQGSTFSVFLPTGSP
jgi:signal transduction histidine kinase